MERTMALLLDQIREHEPDPTTRDGLVYTALGLAHRLNYDCGIYSHEENTMDNDLIPPDHMVAFIMLPTGVVSWIMAASRSIPGSGSLVPGATTERIEAYCRRYPHPEWKTTAGDDGVLVPDG